MSGHPTPHYHHGSTYEVPAASDIFLSRPPPAGRRPEDLSLLSRHPPTRTLRGASHAQEEIHTACRASPTEEEGGTSTWKGPGEGARQL